MSIAEMQASLARLYVSEPFRKWFYADPDAALAAYKLTAQESDALRRFDRDALDLFARSLITKRRKGIERAFPALFTLDGAAMQGYYFRFYHLYPARLDHDRHQDVADFGKFIEETLARAEHVAPCVSDLARYERLYYLAAIATDDAGEPMAETDATPPPVTTMEMRPARRRGVQVADFTCDVGGIEEALRDGWPPGDVPPAEGGCTIVFRPGAGASGVQMLRINTPTKIVLGLCDGSRTVADIVAETEAALGATGLGDAIIATIDRLRTSLVLGLDVEAAVHDLASRRPYGGAVQSESL